MGSRTSRPAGPRNRSSTADREPLPVSAFSLDDPDGPLGATEPAPVKAAAEPPQAYVDGHPVAGFWCRFYDAAFIVSASFGSHEFTRVDFASAEYAATTTSGTGTPVKAGFLCGDRTDGRIGGDTVVRTDYSMTSGLLVTCRNHCVTVPASHCQATWTR